MPIFEYRCKDCNLKFEKIVFNREAPPPSCPECGSNKVEKLISAPSMGGGGGESASYGGGGGACSSGFT